MTVCSVLDNVIHKQGEPFFPVGFVAFQLTDDVINEMKEMGCNSVHFEVGWDLVFPENGDDVSQIGLERIRSYVELVDHHRICAFVLLTGHYVPHWYYEQYEHTGMLNREGSPTKGAWFPVSPFHPMLMHELTRFWSVVTQELSNASYVVGYSMWNEPSLNSIWKHTDYGDYSHHAVERFRNKMVEKYGNIGRLNESWNEHNVDFGSLKPPCFSSNRVKWYDWITALQEMYAQFFVDAYSEVKKGNGDKIIFGKFLPVQFSSDSVAATSGYNWGIMSGVQDIMGMNEYTATPYESRYFAEMMSTIYDGKPVVLFETGVMPPLKDARTVDNCRTAYWGKIVGGVKGIFTFMYDYASSESSEHSFANPDAYPQGARDEVIRMKRLISDHGILFAAKRRKAKIGIVHSMPSVVQHAFSGSFNTYFKGAYELLRNTGYILDAVADKDLQKKGKDYEMLVLPSDCILDEDGLQFLDAYVKNEGKLLAFSRALSSDVYNNPIPVPSVLGIKQRREPFGKRENVSLITFHQGYQRYFEGNIHVHGAEMFDVVEGREILPGQSGKEEIAGEVIAYSCDSQAIIVRTNGGRVFYCGFDSIYSGELRAVIEGIMVQGFGIFPEIHIIDDDDKADHSILSSIFERNGLVYVVLLNSGCQTRKRRIRIAEAPDRIWDVLEGQAIDISKQGDGRVEIEMVLPARDGKLLALGVEQSTLFDVEKVDKNTVRFSVELSNKEVDYPIALKVVTHGVPGEERNLRQFYTRAGAFQDTVEIGAMSSTARITLKNLITGECYGRDIAL